MKRLMWSFAWAIVVLLGSVDVGAHETYGRPITSVEANVRVTHDGAIAHMQSDIAVNPLNPADIVGATTVFAKTTFAIFNKSYTSLDGGYTWSDTTPYQERQGITADPQVVFTKFGTVLFVSLDAAGRFCNVYRSVDGGVTWEKPIRLPASDLDHEVVAVDGTDGRYSNRIYIAGEAGLHAVGSGRSLSLYTSDNDGRTFVLRSTPETNALGEGRRFDRGGVIAMGLAVLGDGNVVLDFSRSASLGDVRTDFQRNFVAVSTNGGQTFGTPVKVADIFVGSGGQRESIMRRRADDLREGNVSDADPSWAKMAAGGSAYPNRLYVVWEDMRSGLGRITYVSSSNEGKTWSSPKRVGTLDLRESQFQPMIATNAQGSVAVSWYSTAGFPRGTRFNAYVAISNDGGLTFSEPERVSSEPSFARTQRNLTPLPLIFNRTSERTTSFFSAYSLCPDGGDEVGLAGASDGVFYFYWPDSRGAGYEIYSARIHAGRGPLPPRSAAIHDVTEDIALVFDPVRLDKTMSEVDVPIRLKNISRHTLFGPIAVTFISRPGALRRVEVLNATTGGRGYGATMDYSRMLGSYGALLPKAVTEPVVWQFRVSDLNDFPPLELGFRTTARY